MSDKPSAWIISSLQGVPSNASNSYVWCLDENALNGLGQLPHENLEVVTNRWDVAEQAKQHQLKTTFSDFDLSHFPDNSFDGFFYRISKEKPLVHHLLNQAWRTLKMGGELYLAGYKNEGTKTYIEKIAGLFTCDKSIKKDGEVYSARLIKNTDFDSEHALQTSDYTQLRPIPNALGLDLVSKPGIFGWNKIDVGSQLLITQLQHFLAGHELKTNDSTNRVGIDLGCGYGYLAVAAKHCAKAIGIETWILTDNNAAALAAAARNGVSNQLNGQVIAGDAGSTIDVSADLILCNPPFHQGFNLDGDLTDKFLASARRLLKRDGTALFVVNQFIPLERKAASLFRDIELLAIQDGFKVVKLASPIGKH